MVWLPEKYRQLCDIISSRMKVPRENVLYLDCTEVKKDGIDNILLLLVSKFYSLSPLDTIEKVTSIREQLLRSAAFSEASTELDDINSAEELIAAYQAKFQKLIDQYADNPDLPYLSDHIFQEMISDFAHNTRAIHIDNTGLLPLTEQQRIANILYTRGHV